MIPSSLTLRRFEPARPAARLQAWLQAWLRAAWQRHRRRADARAAVLALSQLDARTLHDIGLDRSEIGSAAWELAGLAPRERRAARPVPVHLGY